MADATQPSGPKGPDVRGWAIIGFFGITFAVLGMIAVNPMLLANASFMQFIQALTTGGILLVASNLFGGTRSGAETTAKIADTLSQTTTTPPTQPTGSTEPKP